MGVWETSGQSNDWYTPKSVFDALGCSFDMDVAAPLGGPLYVPTHRWLSCCALEADWFGFVWMNPPFGGRNGLAPWLDKFVRHGNGVALTPDRTSAPWFQAAWQHADLVLFTRRICFVRPDGSEGPKPSCGAALWAVGNRGCEAVDRAARHGFGILARPDRPAIAAEMAA